MIITLNVREQGHRYFKGPAYHDRQNRIDWNHPVQKYALEGIENSTILYDFKKGLSGGVYDGYSQKALEAIARGVLKEIYPEWECSTGWNAYELMSLNGLDLGDLHRTSKDISWKGFKSLTLGFETETSKSGSYLRREYEGRVIILTVEKPEKEGI